MLSSVLNSDRAIEVNVQIMRTFMKIRELLFRHKDLEKKIKNLEKHYNEKFSVVFKAIKALLEKTKNDSNDKRFDF